MDNTRPNLRLADDAPEAKDARATALDARVLSSLLIKLSIEKSAPEAPRDAHTRLAELTRSPAIQAVLDAASSLAEKQGIPGEAALRHMVSDILEMNDLWKHVLLKEGVTRLTSQYH